MSTFNVSPKESPIQELSQSPPESPVKRTLTRIKKLVSKDTTYQEQLEHQLEMYKISLEKYKNKFSQSENDLKNTKQQLEKCKNDLYLAEGRFSVQKEINKRIENELKTDIQNEYNEYVKEFIDSNMKSLFKEISLKNDQITLLTKENEELKKICKKENVNVKTGMDELNELLESLQKNFDTSSDTS